MARRRMLTALGLVPLVAVSAILAASGPGMAPAAGAHPGTATPTSQHAATVPIVAIQAAEARPTDPHDLSTFDRQLQPGALVNGLTVVTR
jgi:hypothetical protein